ncbi:hypothetical protein EI94DRAFT_854808 [Lactarius quietus]|nr:hypothetical protein EI94DRAFT_854808 [Lactarius quietus]
MTRQKDSQRREEIVALGTMGYDNAVRAMMATIGDRLQSIDAWNNVLLRLGDPEEGERENVTESRDEHLDLVTKATRVIQRVKAIHSEVIENYTTLDQRTIGFVLHSEKIEVSVEPYKFTKDWALIQLYNDKIDWTTFKGNKLWVGGRLSISEYGNTMFPQPQDRKNYSYPEDGLLQAYDFVREAEMRNPQQLDVHGEKCLLVVKNGLTTGTTVGRVNGLESFRRVYGDYGIGHKSLEIAVLPYDQRHGKFSDAGDSGSVVLDRGGRIVGILTGGSGPTDETNITYVTPYWWVEEQVKAKFPVASSTKSLVLCRELDKLDAHTSSHFPVVMPVLLFSRLVSSHHTRSLPPSPSRSSYLLARCRYRCRGSLFTFVYFFVFFCLFTFG